jgi:hypothetical protein
LLKIKIKFFWLIKHLINNKTHLIPLDARTDPEPDSTDDENKKRYMN